MQRRVQDHAGQDGSVKADRGDTPPPDQATVAVAGLIGNLLHARLQDDDQMAAALWLLDARYVAGGRTIVKQFTFAA
jgi:hypothetical protein